MGSNLGDRLGALRQARAQILRLPFVDGADYLCAPLYETEPVNCPPGSGVFLNTVLEVNAVVFLSPPEFLERLREIETAFGRPLRYPRNIPRPVDLDILYAGACTLDSPTLTLPHPRLARRRFVLEPLAAIRPELILPGFDKPIARLLHELDDPAKVRMLHVNW